ncbi:MAG: CTP synthase, partial [Akkermansia sp.]
KKKIGMFCNVPPRNVVAFCDVKHSIYECPIDLGRDRIDRIVTEVLGITVPHPKMADWQQFVGRVIHPNHSVRIAVVGKYISLQDAYKSIYESFTHAGAANDCRVEVVRVDAEALEQGNPEELIGDVDGILVPGGFGDRGIEGKIAAARYAREKGIPYFGICLGMQIACIEFARNVLGLADANSTEFDKHTPHPIICLQEEQKHIENMGATMRLGAYPANIKPGTLCSTLYGGEETISERHRHRYEFNADYREAVEAAGLVISAVNDEHGLVEVVELPGHPFYIACQYHPEFQSRPTHPHPLFSGLVAAALRHKKED